MGTYPDDTHTGCSSSQWPACGIYEYYSRYSWGQNYYPPWHSGGSGGGNVIVLADDDFTTWGWGVAYRWPSWAVDTIKLATNRLRTQHTEYWAYYGWTEEPQNTGYPGWPDPPPDASSGMSSLSGGGGDLDFDSPQVQLGKVVAEYGVDLNGNGQYDQLVIEAEVTVARPGGYRLLGQLSATEPMEALIGTGGVVSEAWVDTQ